MFPIFSVTIDSPLICIDIWADCNIKLEVKIKNPY